MKKLNLVLSLALFVSGSAVFADTLNSAGSTPAVASAFNPTGAFWNNTSSDVVNGSQAINVGNFLSDTGAVALNGNVTAGCPTCGTNYMASGGQMYVNAGNTPDYVSGLNFVRQAGALQITLLYANSGANGFAEFGIYDVSNPNVNHVILQGGLGQGPGSTMNLNNAIGGVYTQGTGTGSLSGTVSLATGAPYANWGLYVRTCTEGSVTVAKCMADGDIVTYYMGAASQEGSNFVPYDTAHQHFALFQAGTNANQYYAGLEDWAFNASDPNASTNGVEGYGDFNDLIFGITSSISSVPEPATLSIVGLGLAGLGILGRRKLKK
jgi:hypothetical protein